MEKKSPYWGGWDHEEQNKTQQACWEPEHHLSSAASNGQDPSSTTLIWSC